MRSQKHFRLRVTFGLLAMAMPVRPAAGPAALVSRADVKAALAYLESHQEAHLEKQIAIAQIAAPPFHEENRAKAMAEEFRRVRLADVEIDSIGNVLGWRRGSSPRTLVIAAHLDTVFPPGTDVTVKRAGGRLTGPGLVDDSRGLAAILALAEALESAGIHTRRTLLFVADVGEEGLGNLRGIRYLLTESRYRGLVDAFISVDGSHSNAVIDREMGSRRYRVTVTGPGGHSFQNFGRVNPAHALGRIIASLASLQPPASPKTTYNVGRIGGGTSVNSIPFEAWMEFDMRSEDEDTLIRLEQEFLKRAAAAVDEENRLRAASGTAVKLDARRVAVRHAVANGRNRDLANEAFKAALEAGLGEPTFLIGSTDSNVPMSLGIPAVTIDGGGRCGNLHSLEEWFDPEGAYRGVQKILLTILGYDEFLSAKGPDARLGGAPVCSRPVGAE